MTAINTSTTVFRDTIMAYKSARFAESFAGLIIPAHRDLRRLHWYTANRFAEVAVAALHSNIC